MENTSRFSQWIENIIEASLLLAVAFLPISKALVEIGVSVSLLLWLAKKTWQREKLLTIPFFNVIYPIFLLVVCLSLINIPAESLKLGFRGILKWLEYVGLFFLCAEVFQNPVRRKRLLVVFLISMTVTSLNGFYQLWSGTDLLRHRTLDPGRITRMKSSLGAPNTLASFFLFAIPLSYAAGFKNFGKNLKSIIVFLIFILFCSAFIFTFSRAAFFGLLLSVIFHILVYRKWKLSLLLVAGTALLLFVFKDLYANYIGSLNLKDITIGERLGFWKTAWGMVQEHPFLGNGVNMYFHKLTSLTPAVDSIRKYAHNSYLQMWGEIGLFGLLAFILPFLYTLCLTVQKKMASTENVELLGALSIGVLAFLIQSFFDTNFYGLETSVLFWIFFGTQAGLLITSRASKEAGLR